MGYTTDEMLRDARDEAAESQATIADLRSRLLLFADYVCEGCGCAPVGLGWDGDPWRCDDCVTVDFDCPQEPEYPAACVSVGMRALAGTQILEGLG